MTAAATETGYRAVIHSAAATPASDGEGVNLLRVIGTPALQMIDPFLMLDEFGSPEPARHDSGFPDQDRKSVV